MIKKFLNFYSSVYSISGSDIYDLILLIIWINIMFHNIGNAFWFPISLICIALHLNFLVKSKYIKYLGKKDNLNER